METAPSRPFAMASIVYSTFSNCAAYSGGAIFASNEGNGSAILAVHDTSILYCTSETEVGAIVNRYDTFTGTGLDLRGNKARTNGSAIVSGTLESTKVFRTTLESVLVAENGYDNNPAQSTVEVYGRATISNATIANNRDECGLYSTASAFSVADLILTNSIVWGNGAINVSADGTFEAHNTVVKGGSGVTSGEIWDSELDEAPYDRYYVPKSNWQTEVGRRVVDTGDNSFVTIYNDAAGETRIVNGTVDLGALELQSSSNAVEDAFAELFIDGYFD